MAIEKTIKINVDATGAEQNIDGLGNSFQELNQETEQSNKSLRELQKQLREMAIAGETNTQEFKDLSLEVANMQKAVKKANKEVSNLSKGFKQNLQGSLQGAVYAFELGQGVMGAFGVESEKVEQAILKVQSAMAIAHGVEGLKKAIPAFQNLGKTAINALKGIRSAIAATGIGLLVVAVGTLVAYWDDIKAAVSGVSEEQKKLRDLAIENAKIENEKLKSIGNQTSQLKLQGKSEREILKIKQAQIDSAIQAQEIAIQTAETTLENQIEADKRNKEFLKNALQFIMAPLDLLLKTVDGIAEFFGEELNLSDQVRDWQASLLFDPEETEEKGKEVIAEQRKVLEELREQRASTQLAINSIDNSAAEERKRRREEEAAENQKLLDEEEQKRLEQQAREAEALSEFLENKAALEDEYLQSKLSKEQQEVNAVYDKYFALIEAAKQYGEDTALLEEAQQAAVKEIQDRYQAEREAAAEAERDRLEKERIDKKAKDDADAKAELEREAALRNAKIEMAQQSLKAISDLVKAFAGESEEAQRRAFNINKAISIGQAIISTAQGIITQLAVPQDALTGANFIKAGIVAATGAAQIATISATQFQASSSGGGGGGTTPTAPNPPTAVSSPAVFNVVGNTGTNQLAETLGQQPLQAYVVAGDVTTAQSLERNKIQQSTL